jgi:cytochrome c biogenesis protein CcdA
MTKDSKASLLRWFGKIYVFTFYVAYKFASSFNNENYAEENAVFLMGLLLLTLFVELVSGVALLTGKTPITLPKIAILVGFAVVLLLTYFLIVKEHKWFRYKMEFEQYSKSKHFFASLGVGVLVVAAFLGIAVVKEAIGGIH